MDPQEKAIRKAKFISDVYSGNLKTVPSHKPTSIIDDVPQDISIDDVPQDISKASVTGLPITQTSTPATNKGIAQYAREGETPLPLAKTNFYAPDGSLKIWGEGNYAGFGDKPSAEQIARIGEGGITEGIIGMRPPSITDPNGRKIIDKMFVGINGKSLQEIRAERAAAKEAAPVPQTRIERNLPLASGETIGEALSRMPTSPQYIYDFRQAIQPRRSGGIGEWYVDRMNQRAKAAREYAAIKKKRDAETHEANIAKTWSEIEEKLTPNEANRVLSETERQYILKQTGMTDADLPAGTTIGQWDKVYKSFIPTITEGIDPFTQEPTTRTVSKGRIAQAQTPEQKALAAGYTAEEIAEYKKKRGLQ